MDMAKIKVKFLGQVKKVEAKNLVSLDKGIGILLYSGDIRAWEVGKIPADKNVIVTIEESL